MSTIPNNTNNVAILSKAATEEILGDDLCFVIAFGKNGEVIPYLHHGIETEPEAFQNFNPMDYIDVNFNLPEEEQPQALGLFSAPKPCGALGLMRLAKRCLVNGQWITCNGFPCP
jgi:hypothetical protein